MSVVGIIMWKTIDGHFDIARHDNVICYSCIVGFTISTICLAIGSLITLLIFCCYLYCKLHKFNFGYLITTFYTVAGIAAIIILITAPVWFSKLSDNILQNFEESSKSLFRTQSTDDSFREIWDDYQSKFGCCGVQNYKDYYKYFGRNYPIPVSCCNYTTLTSARLDCLTIINNVTDEDVSSYYIYGKGCPYVIVDKLNLSNSTFIHDATIGIIVCSAFVFISALTIFVFTMIVIPEDKNQCICLIGGLLICMLS